MHIRFFIIWLIGSYLLAYSADAQLTLDSTRLPYPATPTTNGNGIACATDILLKHLRVSKGYMKQEADMNEAIRMAIVPFSNDTVVLPVVFHILSNNPSAISNAVIQAGLADLNDAFAKRGAWIGSKGVDTRIRFCLARVHPEGGNTTGINRVETHWGNHVNPLIEDAMVKATAQWDPQRYINIWLVNSIDLESIATFECGNWFRLGTGGYATLPPGGGPLDGIVTTGFGLVLAHEMGHYLGLYHTFEGFCTNNNCTIDGDKVCDTPPDGSYRASASCNSPENSCNTDTLSNYSNGNFTQDVPDPIDNIMDYSNAACQNAFTQGQADRMMAAINTQRPGLLQPKCDVACTENVYAGFQKNNVAPKIGDVVNFQNTSTGATSYEWRVDGVLVSTNQNYQYTFNTAGIFKISLKAIFSATCFSHHTENIKITCGVVSRFFTNKHAIASKSQIFEDSIVFTNQSVNATSYQWLMAMDPNGTEQLISTNTDLVYMFANPGNYTLRLIASSGTCSDTSNFYRLNVADPTPDAALYINTVHCYDQTKVRVNFYVCNFGYDTIPAQTPVSFYDADPTQPGANKLGASFLIPSSILGNCCSFLFSHIVEVGAPGLDRIYVVLADDGSNSPLVFPVTGMLEKDYLNNIQSSANFQFRIQTVPASVTMEPGDTVKLTAFPYVTNAQSFVWSNPVRLSCTNCQSPNYIADTNRTSTKRVIGTSIYGCYDTAFVNITVPPYHDFRLRIDEAACAGTDSIHVKFTVFNDFKRGILPKGLTVRFFNGNPALANTQILPGEFVLQDTIPLKEFSFSTTIKRMPDGTLFGMVNHTGSTPPITMPVGMFEEKDYSNNIASIDYNAEVLQLLPQDTTLLRGASFTPNITSTLVNALSTVWQNGSGYSLSCTNCTSPLITATQPALIGVQSLNAYGCALKGTLQVRIMAPDFTLQINGTECINNGSTQINFSICMNNAYDTVWQGIPVSFYEGNPGDTNSQLLQTVFFTPNFRVGNCSNFTHTISTPSINALYGVVNDRGLSSTPGPDIAFTETNTQNNIAEATGYSRFKIFFDPADTTIERGSSITLFPLVEGGAISNMHWSASPFLSCLNCNNPLVTPLFTNQYFATATNQNQCTDTAWVTVRTFTIGDVYIPSGFTPNGDGLNDIFYIMGSQRIEKIEDFIIYSRYGDKIFEAHQFAPNDPAFGWRGLIKTEKAPVGAYVYQALIRFIDGKTEHRKGTVTLIR